MTLGEKLRLNISPEYVSIEGTVTTDTFIAPIYGLEFTPNDSGYYFLNLNVNYTNFTQTKQFDFYVLPNNSNQNIDDLDLEDEFNEEDSDEEKSNDEELGEEELDEEDSGDLELGEEELDEEERDEAENQEELIDEETQNKDVDDENYQEEEQEQETDAEIQEFQLNLTVLDLNKQYENIFIRGSWNNWSVSSLVFQEIINNWFLPINIPAGTYLWNIFTITNANYLELSPNNLSFTIDEEGVITGDVQFDVTNESMQINQTLNETLMINIAEDDSKIILAQGRAEIGKPVQWIMNIPINEETHNKNLMLDVPRDAFIDLEVIGKNTELNKKAILKENNEFIQLNQHAQRKIIDYLYIEQKNIDASEQELLSLITKKIQEKEEQFTKTKRTNKIHKKQNPRNNNNNK